MAMIIITGTILAKPDSFEELRTISLEHVQRSRTEPGCLSHDVHVDAENPLRLFFFERWADREAVSAHFAVRESREFVKAVSGLAAEQPVVQIYSAEAMSG
jgi:quinol monooxygenase YgiN